MKFQRILALGIVSWLALTGRCVQAQSGYSGPSILSRSSAFQGRPQARPLKFRPYIGFSGWFGDGLAGVSQNNTATSNGSPPLVTSYGLGLTGGVYGVKNARRSTTTFGWSGTVTKASRSYSGSDQSLVLSHERQLTRRWGFFTSHSAGTQNSVLRTRSILQQDQFQSNFEQSYVNYFEPLDLRLYYLNSDAGFTLRISRRLAASFDGGLFTVQRTTQALASARGARAQGEISYSLGPNQSLGVVYGFNFFSFKNSFGESYTNSAQLSYGRRLSRNWSTYLRVGPYRVASDRLRTVAVDPYIASLTGQLQTIEAFHSISQGVGYGGGLEGRGRRSSLVVSVSRSISPGNGITLTSIGETASAYYSYTAPKNISVGGGGFYAKLDPLLPGASNRSFATSGVSTGISLRIADTPLFITGNVEVARVQYNSTNFNVTRHTASVGLSFSPGDVPLRWR